MNSSLSINKDDVSKTVTKNISDHEFNLSPIRAAVQLSRKNIMDEVIEEQFPNPKIIQHSMSSGKNMRETDIEITVQGHKIDR